MRKRMKMIPGTRPNPAIWLGRGIFFRLPVLLLLCVPAVLAQDAAKTPATHPLRVLMLFGASRDVPASLVLEQTVRTELQKGATNNIEFFTENLDWNHFSDEGHFRLFEDYLAKKYAGQKFDLVMSLPSRDYRLAGELPATLFPGTPVVFVNVSEMEPPQEIQKYGVTGIIQRFDLRGTVGLILRLKPDTRHILVVGGTTAADRAALQRVKEIAQSSEEVEFDYYTNRPFAELVKTAGSLPHDTAILISSVQQDTTGEHYFMSELSEMLAREASVPIFVLGSGAIGSGAVGGVVVNAEDLGRQTARMALRVLDGAKPAAMPVEVVANGTPMLDWRALKRWDMAESRVPGNGIVLYRPETLWGQHRDLIVFLAVIFALQSITIAGLIIQRQHRQRAELEVLAKQVELAHVGRVATLGQFASALAHELNQPLGAILRNTEAAEIYLSRENPDLKEIRTILADIRSDDQRAGSVIQRMRALLKYRGLELRPVEVQGLLTDVVALARSAAEVRHVGITLRIPEKLPLVRGDRVHLQQVLLNLILNGMDAMNELPGTARKMTVSAEASPKGTVEVAVSDSGKGIAPGNLARVFESFFTTKPEGMGMGLSISQTIIEAHGGKIWAGNQAGGGAVFTFSLPVQKDET